MRGVRCKTLRRDFIKRLGRAPEGPRRLPNGMLQVSEWRRLKRMWKTRRDSA